MPKYHPTPDGPRICSAEEGGCPLQQEAERHGEPFQHFDNLYDANQAWAADLEGEFGSGHTKTFRKGSTNSFTMTNASSRMPADLRRSRLLTGTEISGQIDPTTVAELGPQTFGLREWSDEELNQEYNATKGKTIWEQNNGQRISSALSREYVASLPEVQAGALSYYTTHNYDWVNSALFHPEKLQELPDEMPENHRVDAETVFMEISPGRYLHPQTGQESKQLLVTTVKNLDQAMTKVPPVQKVVYRGAGSDVDGDRTLQEWMESERAVGSVVEVDGYASASYSLNTALAFGKPAKAAGQPSIADLLGGGTTNTVPERVVYEILTPEGAPVESISEAPGEEEVLLPRRSRYVVVGTKKNLIQHHPGHANSTVHVVQMVAVDEDNFILDEQHRWTPPNGL